MQTVLIADDFASVYAPLRDFLVDQGYNVIVVEDREGLAARAGEADALIVDARLTQGHLDGLSTVAELIQEGRVSPKVPVVFISIYSEDSDFCQHGLRELPILKNRYVWLQKHFEYSYLLKVIGAELSRRAHATS